MSLLEQVTVRYKGPYNVRALDHELGGAARSPGERTYTPIPAGSSRRGTGTSAWAGTQRENETQHRSRPCHRPPPPRSPPPRPPRPPHPHPRQPTLEASIASGACARASSTHGQTHPQRIATQKEEEDHVHDERWNSVLALATGTLLARVKKTSPQALAQEELLARVQYYPPQALALGHQARVQYSPPQALALGQPRARVQYSPLLTFGAWTTAGTGATFSTADVGA